MTSINMALTRRRSAYQIFCLLAILGCTFRVTMSLGGETSLQSDADDEGQKAVSTDPCRRRLDAYSFPFEMETVLADITEAISKKTDTPLFWHVPKAGGTSMKEMYSRCYGMVEATKLGEADGHDRDETLQVLSMADGLRFVNVDVSTPKGIARARALNLAPSHLAHIVFSPIPADASSLFTPDHRGRMFAVLRHPIDRFVSLFHYMRYATWEPSYQPHLHHITLKDYVLYEDQIETNWMVRSLVNKFEVPDLTVNDLETAKEILRRKCIVGFVSDLRGAAARFDRYFDFPANANAHVQQCRERYLSGGENKNPHKPLDRESDTYRLLEEKNYLDIQLYHYALELYEEQASLFL